MSKNNNTQKIVGLGLFTAIVIVLQLMGRKVNTIASVKRALTRRVRFENRCFMGCSFLW